MEQAAGVALSSRRLPSFALPERSLSSAVEASRDAHGGKGSAVLSVSAAPGVNADPLGATVSVGRRSTDDSPRRSAAHKSADAMSVSHPVTGWSLSRSSAGSSPAHRPAAPGETALPTMSLQAASAARPALQPMQAVNTGIEVTAPSMGSDHGPDNEGGNSSIALAGHDDAASAGIRALTREISELAYVDRDQHGSPLRRYRPTDDAEEHHASAASQEGTDAWEASGVPQQRDDVQPTSEVTGGQEAGDLAASRSLGQDKAPGSMGQDMLEHLPPEAGE